jgi:hypothetical protein
VSCIRKFKQVDWPLGSNEISSSQKSDVLIYSKKITLVVEKGTNKITHFLNPQLQLKKDKRYSSKKHVCCTCKEEITEISRVLIMCDKDGGPRLLFFHYFFPCWDMDLLCQKYPDLVIDRFGFSFPESLQISESCEKDLKQNLEFWN